MTVRTCPRCDVPRLDDLRWCPRCGLDFDAPPTATHWVSPGNKVTPPAGDPQSFRYDKAGAGVSLHADRLELTNGVLWKKKTHTIPLRAVIGVSVVGFGGSTLIIQTAGRSYAVAVGMGAAAKIRDRILEALQDPRG